MVRGNVQNKEVDIWVKINVPFVQQGLGSKLGRNAFFFSRIGQMYVFMFIIEHKS